jgi:cytochrome c biogenesis protein CcdA
LIPNHWLPLVAVAKAEGWSKKEITKVAFLSALAHVSGTVLLGIVLGNVGQTLARRYDDYVHIIAPVLLIVFGLIYFTINLPHHHHSKQEDVSAYKRSKRRWILIFVVMMFLSPCLEVESLFLSAGAYGMNHVFAMAVAYAIVSISGIVALVLLAFQGVKLMNAHFFEHHEKRLTGGILIGVGILSFFIH